MNKVEIEDGVTSIGAGAFLWCESLRKIVIPDSVKEIGEYAFAYDDKLKVEIPCALEYSTDWEIPENRVVKRAYDFGDGCVCSKCGFENHGPSEYVDKDYHQCGSCHELVKHKYVKGICTSCGDEVVDQFLMAGVTLSEQIALDYKIWISEDLISKATGIEFVNKADGTTQLIDFADAIETEADGVKCYQFRLILTSTQMEDKIVARMIYSDGTEGEVFEYSIAEYLQALTALEGDDRLSSLAEAMELFGKCMKGYAANDLASIPTVILSEDEQDYIKYYAVNFHNVVDTTDTIDTIGVEKVRVNMGSLMSVTAKYTYDTSKDYKFFVNGKEVTPKVAMTNDDYYYEVTSEYIAPKNYDKLIKFTVELDGTEETLYIVH